MHFQQKYLAIESNCQKHFLSAKRAAKTVKTMLFEFLDVITLWTLLDIYKYDGPTEIASRYDPRCTWN